MKVKSMAIEDQLARNEFVRTRLAEGRGFLEEGRFADAAQAFLIDAEFTADMFTRQMRLEAAKVCASLSLGDKIQEATATLKEIANRQIDSNAELGARLREVA